MTEEQQALFNPYAWEPQLSTPWEDFLRTQLAADARRSPVLAKKGWPNMPRQGKVGFSEAQKRYHKRITTRRASITKVLTSEFQSSKTISDKAGVKHSTAVKILRIFRDKGMIEVNPHRHPSAHAEWRLVSEQRSE